MKVKGNELAGSMQETLNSWPTRFSSQKIAKIASARDEVKEESSQEEGLTTSSALKFILSASEKLDSLGYTKAAQKLINASESLIVEAEMRKEAWDKYEMIAKALETATKPFVEAINLKYKTKPLAIIIKWYPSMNSFIIGANATSKEAWQSNEYCDALKEFNDAAKFILAKLKNVTDLPIGLGTQEASDCG